MTTDRDFDRLARAWLDLMPDEAPDRTVAAVLQAVETTPQVRRPIRWLTWRSQTMNRLPIALGAAAVVVVAGTVLLSRAGTSPPVAASASPPATIAPTSPTPAPTTANDAKGWDAIYVRQDPGDATHLDIVLVRPDGRERTLRQIRFDVEGSSFPLSGFGSMSESGWLALGTTSSGQLPIAAYELFDLSNPTRNPLVLPYPPVITGRWSSNDLFALSSAKVHTPTGWMNIDVVNPRTGATTELGPLSLYGGGPSIVWTWDGSGILNGQAIQPVSGGPNIPIDPTTRFLDRQLGMGGKTVEVCRASDPGTTCPDGTRIRINGAVDWYTVRTKANEEPASAIFAADGRSLLVTILRTEGQRRQAAVVRMAAPDTMVELGVVNIADDGWAPGIGTVASDDSAFTIQYLTGPNQGPVDVQEAGILHADGTATRDASGNFAGFVSGRLAESWPALGEFGPPTSSPTP